MKKNKFVLDSFEAFMRHQWVESRQQSFERTSLLAEKACEQKVELLADLNESYLETHDRVLFTSVDYRVKSRESFFKKLHSRCKGRNSGELFTEATVTDKYSSIKDIAGVRFACPYFDEILPAISDHVRPWMRNRSFGEDLNSDPQLRDKNMLDSGDTVGIAPITFTSEYQLKSIFMEE